MNMRKIYCCFLFLAFFNNLYAANMLDTEGLEDKKEAYEDEEKDRLLFLEEENRILRNLNGSLINLLLLEKKEQHNGMNLFHLAVYEGYDDVVESLIVSHPEFIKVLLKGKNILQLAIEQSHIKIVKILSKYDSRMIRQFKKDAFNPNMLFVAVKKSSSQVCEYLFNCFPDLAMQVCEYGWTLLHYAVINKNKAVCMLLVKQFPNMVKEKTSYSFFMGTMILSFYDQTPLDMANSKGYESIVKVIELYS